ncbi:MAG: orotidine-5'-phosphate decarboxylase [Alphaproteobacteria bacterium]|nr:orotidine-5'-phosphate decarboxylase [Alphaproteobacteria bacterium]
MTSSDQELRNPIFCAIDTSDLGTATTWAARIGDHVGGIKLGLEFISAHGPKGVMQVMKASGLPAFLDVKFHDIPNTVAGAVRAIAAVKPYMINVHAGGGRAMMRAAAEAASEAAYEHVVPRPLVIGVTILTSLADDDLAEVGMAASTAEQAVRLAVLAKESGLDGVVCSPLEASRIRSECGPNFKLVTPGVRPEWAAANDQKRIMTPEQAIAEGADYLVVGRPITAADDPSAAAQRIATALAA